MLVGEEFGARVEEVRAWGGVGDDLPSPFLISHTIPSFWLFHRSTRNAVYPERGLPGTRFTRNAVYPERGLPGTRRRTR